MIVLFLLVGGLLVGVVIAIAVVLFVALRKRDEPRND